jgi:hypothetical protein
MRYRRQADMSPEEVAEMNASIPPAPAAKAESSAQMECPKVSADMPRSAKPQGISSHVKVKEEAGVLMGSAMSQAVGALEARIAILSQRLGSLPDAAAVGEVAGIAQAIEACAKALSACHHAHA